MEDETSISSSSSWRSELAKDGGLSSDARLIFDFPWKSGDWERSWWLTYGVPRFPGPAIIAKYEESFLFKSVLMEEWIGVDWEAVRSRLPPKWLKNIILIKIAKFYFQKVYML